MELEIVVVVVVVVIWAPILVFVEMTMVLKRELMLMLIANQLLTDHVHDNGTRQPGYGISPPSPSTYLFHWSVEKPFSWRCNY